MVLRLMFFVRIKEKKKKDKVEIITFFQILYHTSACNPQCI